MSPNVNRRWLVFWACLLVMFVAITGVYATTVNLIAYVSYSILDSLGVPLADGSVVYIFGSTDNVNNGPMPYGTNLIANSTMGDDVFIGMVLIDIPSYAGSNGTFYSDSQFAFNIDDIHYLYIRFFNTTNTEIQGYTNWGYSGASNVTDDGSGYVVIDFGQQRTVVTNNFVIIPEPSTSHLLLLFLGLFGGLLASMRKAERKALKKVLS